MKTAILGKTGLSCPVLGFGGIPLQRADAENTVKLVDKLEEYGLTYIDTARGYTVSESYLGAALEGRRDKFILATKSMARTYDAMKKDIETSLGNLRTDHIDLYQIHNIPVDAFETVFGEDGAYKALLEAKAEGKIKHIGFTAHKIEAVEKMINEYADKVESVMFPYSIVENQGAELLSKCRVLGIFTIAMKPMAGGNIDDWKLAMRYIANSGVIDVIIPGMGDPVEIDRNYEALKDDSPLSAEELEAIEKIRKDLGSHFCRRCGYCAPCTVGIDIPSAFLFSNYKRKYGLSDWAAGRWASLKVNPAECVECGVCEERCPYELPIRQMLKDAVELMGK
ncbi:MAG: aldo/keto reductase [Clostridia bacterium]|nr:aldo/keto reductase [Clostridia bacterium]